MEKIYKNYGIIICAVFLIISALFVVIYGEDIYIQHHDNLEYGVVWMKLLKDNQLFWETNAEIPFLHGLDRNFLYSELKPYTWLYMVLPCFYAHISGWFIKIIISIIGFIFLSHTIFDSNEKDNLFSIFGLIYGIYPNYPAAAFSFACLPILLSVLIRFHKEPKKWHYVFFFLIPALLEFQFHGVFVCGYILLFMIMDTIVKKHISFKWLRPIAIISIGTIVFEWRFFYGIMFRGVETIRDSFVFDTLPFKDVLRVMLRVFMYGEYTAGSIHTKVLLPVCGAYFFYINFKYILNKQFSRIYQEYYNWILLFICFNAMVYGINKWMLFRSVMARFLPILYGFSFGRTVWFNGFLWCLAAAVVVSRIPNKLLIVIASLCSFIPFIFSREIYNPINPNLRLIKADIFDEKTDDLVTWKEFFAEDLFEKIKLEIGYDQEWSAAFGFSPAILNYNGIHTLDGYHSFYPLDYKREFRELIKPELDIDEYYKNYYDNWGGRAYLFSESCDFEPRKDYPETSADLNIDMEQFKKFNGKYIFSRVKISNADELGIQEIGDFSDDSTFLKVYVYCF